MATPTADELAAIRSEIGDAEPPTDSAIETIFDRLGTVGGVVYEITSKRLADLLASPASFTVTGEYSQSTEANIRAYSELLRKYASFAPGAFHQVTITQPTRRRPR